MATRGQQAEQNMSAADLAALKAAGERYNAATTDAERAQAHADAEAIRANYGYSGGTNGADYIEKTGNARPKTYDTYVLRNGEKIPTTLQNGVTYDQNGNQFQFQNGDYSYTPNSGYWAYNNGSAAQVRGTEQMEALLKQLGQANGYTAKTDAAEVAANQQYEQWLKQNNPELYQQYLQNGVNWNVQNDGGNALGATYAHQAEEAIRAQSGFSGGSNGTAVRVTNPDLVPAELVETFQPYIDRYNQELAAAGQQPITADDYFSLLLQGYPVFNMPELASSPEGQLVLSKLSQFPDFVKAVIANAPKSTLALQFTQAYPEYAVSAAPLENLDYAAQYLPQYWERFNAEYDPERFAADYDAIQQQLIDANQAGVDLGRLQLEAQLENAMPEYDKLKRQNELAKAKAANNMALYNAANGDTGGIGSRQYSLEQNAYDQRMQEIRLEQQNLINTTNQQIAQLEAEGRMKEAEILAQWGQAKLNAMQEQYNQYWDMYQQAASTMENLSYQLATDDWNRRYQLRQDDLNEQLNRYKADVDAYNAALQLAQLQTQIDEANRDYAYQAWRDRANIDLQQASEQNDYNLKARNDELTRAQLQLQIDEANRDYDYKRWLNDTNLAIELANQQYDRDVTRWNTAQELQQVAFNQAMQKLERGMLSADDVKALGVAEDQAQAYADRMNLLAQIDTDKARAELAYTKAQIAKLSGYGSGGSGGSYSGGSNRVSTNTGYTDAQLIERMIADGVTPDNFYTVLNSGAYGKMLSNSKDSYAQMKEEFVATYNKLMGVEPEPNSILDKLYKAGANEANFGATLYDLGIDPKYNDSLFEDYIPYYTEKEAEKAAQQQELEDYLTRWNTIMWGANKDPLIQNIVDLPNKTVTTTPTSKTSTTITPPKKVSGRVNTSMIK